MESSDRRNNDKFADGANLRIKEKVPLHRKNERQNVHSHKCAYGHCSSAIIDNEMTTPNVSMVRQFQQKT